MTPGGADADGLRPAFPEVLCNFHSSDQNNTVIRVAALAESDVDSIVTPYGLLRGKFNCTRDRRLFGREGKMCKRVEAMLRLTGAVEECKKSNTLKRQEAPFTIGRHSQFA